MKTLVFYCLYFSIDKNFIKDYSLCKATINYNFFQMTNNLASRFLTTSEIAKNKGCTTQAIRKAISVKKIDGIRTGRMILVTHKDAVKKLGYLPEAN